MKKRVLCLFLCLVMLLSVALTGCADKTSDEAEDKISEEASESAVTLTMWMVAEKVPSAATANAVSRALNAITNAKFKIQLALQYYTVDEYLTKLSDSITAYEKSRADGKVGYVAEEETEASTGAVTDETETNEYGLSVIKYPEVLANQVDIIYIGDVKDSEGGVVYGEELYSRFIEKGWLAELDKELSSSSKKIKEYVSPTLLSAAKYSGSTYAVPNNNVIGEYTYMLIDRELMDYYHYQGKLYKTTDGSEVKGFYDSCIYNYLDEVAEDTEAGTLELNGVKFVPVANDVDGSETEAYNQCLELLASYWSLSDESFELLKEFSVFGCYYTNAASLSRGAVELKYQSLFNNEAFVQAYLKLNQMRYDGYFKTPAQNERAAVRFVTGDATVLDTYNAALAGQVKSAYDGKDYYAVIVKYPTASSEDIYGSMFGVCSYTRSVSRSMEIITYLNTNADFRNLLQYGVEGTNYKVVTKNNVAMAEYTSDNDYFMDIFKTGNAFIAYPQSTMSPDIWTRGKEQNRNSLVDPLLGFSVASFAEEQAVKASGDKTFSGSYEVTSTTGYSKSVLSEDATIGAWIANCDKAGKGVYVLKTSLTSGSYTTYNFYVYNNGLSKNATVSVEENPVYEDPTATDLILKGVDVSVDYKDAAGISKTAGYELTLVQVNAKKSYAVNVVSADSAKTFAVTEAGLVTFDFNNTKAYTMEVYNNLRLSAVRDNAVLMAFAKNAGIFSATNKKVMGKNNVLTFQKDLGNGKTEYTVVLYRTKLTVETSLTVQPTGDKTGVTVNFLYNENPDSTFESGDYSNYLLTYVKVTVDTGVSVDYTLSKTTKDDTVTVATEDPDFDMVGLLDTEAVKYLQTLNDGLLAILYAAPDYETFAEVVADIAAVTSGNEFLIMEDLQNADVIAFLTDNQINLTDVAEFINIMTSTARPHYTYEDESGAICEDVWTNGEDYVYFETPYSLYVQWLQAYGFGLTKK